MMDQHDFDFEVGAWKIHLKRLDQRFGRVPRTGVELTVPP